MNILMAIFGAVSQGLLWSLMALGVYITFKILDFADMTCDGSFALGGCISAVFCVKLHMNPFLTLFFALAAGGLAGAVTGILHTKLKIPAILSGILTMISLYSINLRIMGQANTPINTREKGTDTIVTMLVKLLPDSLQKNTNQYDRSLFYRTDYSNCRNRLALLALRNRDRKCTACYRK